MNSIASVKVRSTLNFFSRIFLQLSGRRRHCSATSSTRQRTVSATSAHSHRHVSATSAICLVSATSQAREYSVTIREYSVTIRAYSVSLDRIFPSQLSEIFTRFQLTRTHFQLFRLFRTQPCHQFQLILLVSIVLNYSSFINSVFRSDGRSRSLAQLRINKKDP